MSGQAAPSIPSPRIALAVDRRELLVDGAPARIGSRAFEILQLLVEARGTLVTKDEIMRRVWPGVVVEESNVQVQISAIRRALAEHRDAVRTIAGRGYLFVDTLEDPKRGTDALPDGPTPQPSAPTNLLAPMAELIGRDAEVAKLAERVAVSRLTTLTGPGGIGKTRLATAVARAALPHFPDGAWVAELATVTDPELVPGAVAAALGVEFSAGAASVARALVGKQLLLVLDNCEHVIDAAAQLTDALLRANPHAHILATSREPLRVEGEAIVRVPPLGLPESDTLPAAALLEHGAVKLFVSLVAAAEPNAPMEGAAIAAAATICRRLDGIPFAIELAAARAATLGIEGLAARLDDQFRLLTGGRRTALPRQQTLRATLDWSHDALSAAERAVLRRLSVFAGPFSLAAAGRVAAGDDIAPGDVVGCVENLVSKSLIVADVRSGMAQYSLLETTRAYAREKLAEAEDTGAVARRHAAYFCELFVRAQGDLEALPAVDWLPVYRDHMGNLRAALDWAFSAGGDAAIGVDLLVASVPLWLQLSLMEECRERVERALARLGPEAAQPTRRNMRLYAALGYALMPSTAALTRALELAEELEDDAYRLQALWGLWANRLANVALDEALALARRFASIARQPGDRAIADRMLGFTLHFLGDHEAARKHVARMLDEGAPDAHGSHRVRFQFDPWVTARATLGEIQWIQGFPDQAMQTVATAVADAEAIRHTHSLCNTLRKSCPVAFFCGDLDALERFTSMLFEQASRHGFASWHAQAHCYRGLLAIERGDLTGGLQLMRATLEGLPEGSSTMRSSFLRGVLAEMLGRNGEIRLGRTMIDAVLARAEANREGWCLPELLRIKAELLLADGDAAGGEAILTQALQLANRHGALSWELRSATRLAQLRRDQHRPAEARDVLDAVCRRFTEGFATADLRRAQVVLDALG